MKTTRIAALASLVIIASSSAFAADIQIDITGKVQNTTCELDATKGKYTRSVTLDTVTTNALAAAGLTAGRKSEVFNITGCNTEFKTVDLKFENPQNYSANGRLINNAASGATNVEIEVLNGTTALNLRTATPSFTITDGKATLPLAFQYYATAAATQGNVASQLIMSLVYR